MLTVVFPAPDKPGGDQQHHLALKSNHYIKYYTPIQSQSNKMRTVLKPLECVHVVDSLLKSKLLKFSDSKNNYRRCYYN